jgi:helicase
MKISELSSRHGIPREVVSALQASGYATLYPPQAEAVRAGVLEGRNLVLAVPTAAGKTLVAELCMLKSILEGNGRCIYVVPLRALASEKYDEFKKRYSSLGISVGIATGEYDTPGTTLARHHILIATSEKVDSLLRLRARWLAESLSVAVLDEIHYIHDPSRGPTLEVIAARLRQVNPRLQVLALSATIRNGRELAAWLGAELVSSDWRPVPLIEGVFFGNTIYYSDFSTRSLVASRANPVEALVSDTIEEGGQALVFVNSRRSTLAVARALAPHVRKLLRAEEKKLLGELAGEAGGVLSEPTHLCRELAEAITSGVAFHHAGLHREQRRLIEDAFRGNKIKAICATPTLAAGVNLPARRVVVRDWWRYESGRGQQPIPVFEYKQFAGRAGRPGYDTQGEALLVARKDGDREMLFAHYIHADTEPLRSQLGRGGALASHILTSIAAGYAGSLNEIMEFLSLTFFAAQQEVRALSRATEQIIEFLTGEGLIHSGGDGAAIEPSTPLHPTAFGSIVSRLYLEPLSGIMLRSGLSPLAGRTPSDESLLHLVCCCPDMPLLAFRKGDFESLMKEAELGKGRLLAPSPVDADDEVRFFQALHTARMLADWIDEREEEHICENYGIGPGDVRRLIESADWLLYSAEQITRFLNLSDAREALRVLRRRVLYGIKRELLELVSLKGIGRVRARNLFRNGYRTLDDIRRAAVKALSDVPSIGRAIASNIKKQVK